MDAQLPGLAMITLLFVAVLQVMQLVRYRRALETELDEAHATIRVLSARLDDATRPPTQFARMRLRRAAVDRFARLHLAAPRRRHVPEAADGLRSGVH